MISATRTIEYRVANLDCEHDAAALKRGIEGLPGLSDVKVLPKAARITLTYDPAATSPQALKEKVEIDYCPERRGVWLDRGELDKIVERRMPQQAEAPDAGARDYRDDRGYRIGRHGNGHYGRGYRRKFWLHEIFD